MRHGYNKLAARIPTVIYEELQRQGIADDPDLFKAWLDSTTPIRGGSGRGGYDPGRHRDDHCSKDEPVVACGGDFERRDDFLSVVRRWRA